MGEDDLKAEYDTWFTPAEVLGRHSRQVPSESLVRTVASSLADGLMRAIAETMVIPPNGPQPYFELAPRVWRHWAGLTDQDFWALGTLERLPHHPGMRDAGLPHFRAYRVRLERSKVERIMDGAFGPATRLEAMAQALRQSESPRMSPPPSTPAPALARTPVPAAKDQRPKIDPKTLQAWVAEFGARNPGVSFNVFRDNARIAFPKFRVGERPVEAAIAESGFKLRPGNPTILRK
jgi:hypothetical protein